MAEGSPTSSLECRRSDWAAWALPGLPSSNIRPHVLKHNSSLEFPDPLWALARGCRRMDVLEDHKSSGKVQEGPWGHGGFNLIVMARTLRNGLAEGRVLVTLGPSFCPFLSETVVL